MIYFQLVVSYLLFGHYLIKHFEYLLVTFFIENTYVYDLESLARYFSTKEIFI